MERHTKLKTQADINKYSLPIFTHYIHLYYSKLSNPQIISKFPTHYLFQFITYMIVQASRTSEMDKHTTHYCLKASS